MRIQELQKYLHYEFSTGYETGEDYKTFERKYISYLKRICKQNNWAFIKANKNHYCFSAFIKVNGRYIYLSISDVRYFENEWHKNILIRIENHYKFNIIIILNYILIIIIIVFFISLINIKSLINTYINYS